MLKKIFMMISLVSIAIMSLIGCGIEEKREVTSDNMKKKELGIETEQASSLMAKKNAVESSNEETTENIAEEEIFSVQIVEGLSDTKYTEDGRKIIYDFASQNVEAELSQYPDTANTIEQFFQNRNMEIYNSIDADYYYADGEIEMDYHMNIEPQRMDERVVSFLYGGDYYYGSGSLYNNSYYEGVVFDTVTGKRLQLEDIVQDVDEFEKFIESYIAIYIYNSDEILSSFGIKSKWGYNVELPDFDCDIRDNNWFFTDEGMMAICNPSEKWYLSLIRTNILIPYEDLTDYLKSDYIPEEVVIEEKKQINDIDLYEVLYPGATSDSLAKESGLNATLLEGEHESNIYIVDDGKIYFTSFGSSPSIAGIEVCKYAEGVTIAGCRIGMTYEECLECLQQYGFKENPENSSGSLQEVINDIEWKYMDFVLINGIIVHIDYGVFESAADYNCYFYEQM